VTCVWADGKPWTKAMLFTYNKDFRSDRAKQLFRELNIDAGRVVVLEQPGGSRQVYATECADFVSTFFDLHTVNKGDHIMCDGGGSFKVQNISIFEDLGYDMHAVYPAPVHQFLSPNDNRLHGVAKQRWRSAKIDFSDDVVSSLRLLRELDNIERPLVKKWFNINFQLDNDDVTSEAAEACIFGFHRDKNDRADWFKQCKTDYEEFVAGAPQRGSGHVAVKPSALDSEFDGCYWTEYGK
jgi:hypothetical protein